MTDDYVPASTRRAPGGRPRLLVRGLLGSLTLVGALWALEVQHVLAWAVFKEQYLGLFLGLALAGVFLDVRARAGAAPAIPWYDWLLALAGLTVGAYVAVRYPTIAYQLGVLTWDKVLLGALAIGLILEATRRLAGWALVWVAVPCILYAKFAHLLPGVFQAKGASWGRIAAYLYLDTNALLGLPLAVTATIVVAFVLFGRTLAAVGGDRFLTDLALVAMGRFRGGPAKVAVVSSTLFGTVSGSAVANVAVDGAITIPMMKRAGYPPHLAAAIEAVASNGGQLMPPVMGAAAFLIAEFLAIPYAQVALAAAVPALLYYLALPALAQLGILPLAAHLFLFYFGMLSLITPPDCVASYTAAAIARADFWKTGWTGMRLGVAAYLVPFAFALHPALLLRGTPAEIALAIVPTTLGVIALGIGCAGYLFRPLGPGKRGLLGLAGLLAFGLPAGGLWLGLGALGLAVGLALVLWEWSARRAHAVSATVERA